MNFGVGDLVALRQDTDWGRNVWGPRTGIIVERTTEPGDWSYKVQLFPIHTRGFKTAADHFKSHPYQGERATVMVTDEFIYAVYLEVEILEENEYT